MLPHKYVKLQLFHTGTNDLCQGDDIPKLFKSLRISRKQIGNVNGVAIFLVKLLEFLKSRILS